MFDSLRGRQPKSIDEHLYSKFAVLVPLVERDGKLHVLFEVRSGKLKRQPSEICFPGGKQDPGETPLQNAVRETAEELKIDQAQVEVIAQMDTLLTVYDNKVSAFLGMLKDYEMTFSEDEVAEVFLVPLEFFFKNEPKAYRNKVKFVLAEDFPYEKVPGGRNYGWRDGHKDVYFYEYEDRIIWGMTAYIMQSVVRILRDEANVSFE